MASPSNCEKKSATVIEGSDLKMETAPAAEKQIVCDPDTIITAETDQNQEETQRSTCIVKASISGNASSLIDKNDEKQNSIYLVVKASSIGESNNTVKQETEVDTINRVKVIGDSFSSLETDISNLFSQATNEEDETTETPSYVVMASECPDIVEVKKEIVEDPADQAKVVTDSFSSLESDISDLFAQSTSGHNDHSLIETVPPGCLYSPSYENLGSVRKLEVGDEFDSWVEVISTVKDYASATNQPFVRSGMVLAEKYNQNNGNKNKKELLNTKRWKYQSYNFQCSQTIAFRRKMKYISPTAEKCTARITASVNRDKDKIVIQSILEKHTHSIISGIIEKKPQQEYYPIQVETPDNNQKTKTIAMEKITVKTLKKDGNKASYKIDISQRKAQVISESFSTLESDISSLFTQNLGGMYSEDKEKPQHLEKVYLEDKQKTSNKRKAAENKKDRSKILSSFSQLKSDISGLVSENVDDKDLKEAHSLTQLMDNITNVISSNEEALKKHLEPLYKKTVAAEPAIIQKSKLAGVIFNAPPPTKNKFLLPRGKVTDTPPDVPDKKDKDSAEHMGSASRRSSRAAKPTKKALEYKKEIEKQSGRTSDNAESPTKQKVSKVVVVEDVADRLKVETTAFDDQDLTIGCRQSPTQLKAHESTTEADTPGRSKKHRSISVKTEKRSPDSPPAKKRKVVEASTSRVAHEEETSFDDHDDIAMELAEDQANLGRSDEEVSDEPMAYNDSSVPSTNNDSAVNDSHNTFPGSSTSTKSSEASVLLYESGNVKMLESKKKENNANKLASVDEVTITNNANGKLSFEGKDNKLPEPIRCPVCDSPEGEFFTDYELKDHFSDHLYLDMKTNRLHVLSSDGEAWLVLELNEYNDEGQLDNWKIKFELSSASDNKEEQIRMSDNQEPSDKLQDKKEDQDMMPESKENQDNLSDVKEYQKNESGKDKVLDKSLDRKDGENSFEDIQTSEGKETKYGDLEIKQNDFDFSCLVCKIKYMTFKQLKKHKQKHKGAATYDSQRKNLLKKIAPVPNIPSVECEICGVLVKSKYRIRRHLQTHELINDKQLYPNWKPKKTFNCDECDKDFVYSHSLKLHKRTVHMGTKAEYKCGTCKESFPTQNLLNKHIRGGAHPRNYVCNKCNQTFVRAPDLKKHYYITHIKEAKTTDEKINQMGKGPFTCEYCQNVYKSKDNFKFHVKYKHTGELQPVPCDLCNKSFASKQIVQEHKKRVHSEFEHNKQKLFECSVCQKRYNSQAALTKHYNSTCSVGVIKADGDMMFVEKIEYGGVEHEERLEEYSDELIPKEEIEVKTYVVQVHEHEIEEVLNEQRLQNKPNIHTVGTFQTGEDIETQHVFQIEQLAPNADVAQTQSEHVLIESEDSNLILTRLSKS